MGLVRPHQLPWKTGFLLSIVAICPFARARIIHVDAGATGANTGSSWQHAINDLQDALLLAHLSDEPVEIRVAQGTYRPDQGLGIMPGDRTVAFELMNGVTIRGGYAGAGSFNPDARDVHLYQTILSGDIGAPERLDDNSYRVVIGHGVDSTAVLDGCTIAAGNADDAAGMDMGAGMYNDNGSPTVINCTFRGHHARDGAGCYNGNDSRPVFNNCVFSGNSASEGGGGVCNNDSSPILTNCTFAENSAGHGGGMCNEAQSRPALTSCEFIRNAAAGGAGMSNTESNPTLADCTFEENSTTGSGGGMVNQLGKPILLRCTFRANLAGKDGGAVYSHNHCQLAVFNCLFIGNSATIGGGIQSGGGSHTNLTNCTFTANLADSGGALSTVSDAQTTLVNCILWADTPGEIGGGGTTVTYSNIQGGWPGEGNLNTDPLFADPNDDCHLRSQAGRWNPDTQRWVIDLISSPCIDAGRRTDGTGFEAFPNGNRVNMGAYGGTREASLSASSTTMASSKASSPNPPDGAVGVSPNVVLTWTAGSGAVAHDVYLGVAFDQVAESSRDNPNVLVSMGQRTTTFAPGALAPGTSYYWRIDEIDGEDDITKGDVWMFRTISGMRR